MRRHIAAGNQNNELEESRRKFATVAARQEKLWEDMTAAATYFPSVVDVANECFILLNHDIKL